MDADHAQRVVARADEAVGRLRRGDHEVAPVTVSSALPALELGDEDRDRGLVAPSNSAAVGVRLSSSIGMTVAMDHRIV